MNFPSDHAWSHTKFWPDQLRHFDIQINEQTIFKFLKIIIFKNSSCSLDEDVDV